MVEAFPCKPSWTCLMLGRATAARLVSASFAVLPGKSSWTFSKFGSRLSVASTFASYPAPTAPELTTCNTFIDARRAVSAPSRVGKTVSSHDGELETLIESSRRLGSNANRAWTWPGESCESRLESMSLSSRTALPNAGRAVTVWSRERMRRQLRAVILSNLTAS